MLTLERIDVAIAGTRVLRGVEMTVADSGRVALVGRNGAGKTTTLRAIMGLVPLAGGRIGFAGQDLGKVPAHRRTALAIGYAPEERKLFSSFTVEENLRLPAEVLGLPAAETRRRLDKTYAILPEVAEFKDRKAQVKGLLVGKMPSLQATASDQVRLLRQIEDDKGIADLQVLGLNAMLEHSRVVHMQLIDALSEEDDEEEAVDTVGGADALA